MTQMYFKFSMINKPTTSTVCFLLVMNSGLLSTAMADDIGCHVDSKLRADHNMESIQFSNKCSECKTVIFEYMTASNTTNITGCYVPSLSRVQYSNAKYFRIIDEHNCDQHKTTLHHAVTSSELNKNYKTKRCSIYSDFAD